MEIDGNPVKPMAPRRLREANKIPPVETDNNLIKLAKLMNLFSQPYGYNKILLTI